MNQREYQTKREWVASFIREAIAEGELLPGQRLAVEDLAAQLHVSSTPVREALSSLEAEGIVEREAHKGTRVASITLDRIREIYRVRSLLEGLSVESVCRAQEDRTELVLCLTDLHQRIEQAATNSDFESMTALNFDFHMAIHESTLGSWLLAEIIKNVWTRFPFPDDTFAVIPGQVDRSLKQHRGIIEAIRSGKARHAGSLMRKHIEDGTESLILYLEKRDEIGKERSNDSR